MNSKPMIQDVTGVVLAGGASSRFGSNKALAAYNGITLISHVTATLETLFRQHLLITNTPQTYSFLGWPMGGDQFPGAGPLAGIHAALRTMATPRAFITACDMPLVNAELIRYLCSLPGHWDVVLPVLEEGAEPLYAVYHQQALGEIEAALRAKRRKISSILARLRVRNVSQQEILTIIPDLTPFKNINRTNDLHALSVPSQDS